MTEVTLLLGSNLGDRELHIRSALNMLDIALDGHYKAISPIIESKACGFKGPDFLNCAVKYVTTKPPIAVLQICKTLERNMGRTDEPEYDESGTRIYHDRIVDVDILFYGKLHIESEKLTIPHPQVESRLFVRELLSSLKEV